MERTEMDDVFVELKSLLNMQVCLAKSLLDYKPVAKNEDNRDERVKILVNSIEEKLTQYTSRFKQVCDGCLEQGNPDDTWWEGIFRDCWVVDSMAREMIAILSQLYKVYPSLQPTMSVPYFLLCNNYRRIRASFKIPQRATSKGSVSVELRLPVEGLN